MKYKRMSPVEVQILHKSGRALLVLVLVLLLPAFTVPVAAQSGGGYDLTWNTVAGGGGTASGGDYSLGGTAGQPDPGLLTGGDYSLGGGFWGGGALPGLEYRIYLPLVLRGSP
jgi:uncharacterized membrane protein